MCHLTNLEAAAAAAVAGAVAVQQAQETMATGSMAGCSDLALLVEYEALMADPKVVNAKMALSHWSKIPARSLMRRLKTARIARETQVQAEIRWRWSKRLLQRRQWTAQVGHRRGNGAFGGMYTYYIHLHVHVHAHVHMHVCGHRHGRIAGTLD